MRRMYARVIMREGYHSARGGVKHEGMSQTSLPPFADRRRKRPTRNWSLASSKPPSRLRGKNICFIVAYESRVVSQMKAPISSPSTVGGEGGAFCM